MSTGIHILGQQLEKAFHALFPEHEARWHTSGASSTQVLVLRQMLLASIADVFMHDPKRAIAALEILHEEDLQRALTQGLYEQSLACRYPHF